MNACDLPEAEPAAGDDDNGGNVAVKTKIKKLNCGQQPRSRNRDDRAFSAGAKEKEGDKYGACANLLSNPRKAALCCFASCNAEIAH